MSVRVHDRHRAARSWRARFCSAAWSVWQRVCADPLSERDHFLSKASSHADLEMRMREWSDFERRPWLPPL